MSFSYTRPKTDRGFVYKWTNTVNNKWYIGQGATLTEKQVREIKQTSRKGGKWGYKTKLARKYNIHPNTLLDIEKNRTWKWVK